MSRKLILHYVHRFFIPLMVLAIMLLVLMPTSAVRADSVVTFPDPNLQAAIRTAIGKPTGDILQSDLAGLTALYDSNCGIVNLVGLEHCTSLTLLVLHTNQISDISPLAGLTNLRELYLGSNQITNISPLAGLTNLTYLELQSNHITGISPLSGLTNLTSLSLFSNQISDLSPLAGLTGLSLLDLRNNQISDIPPLSGLTSLTMLWLDYNQISNLSPLSGLTNLTSLGLYANQISDIGPLVNNPGIGSGDYLELGQNPLNATSFNVYIPQLQNRGVNVVWATFTMNQPSNVSPANGATALSLTPTLQSSAFSDSDAGATHAASQWQISTTPNDYSTPVLNLTSGSRLTSYPLPSGILDHSTTYYWHVRYQDNNGYWSLWSPETSFTTAAAQVETATSTGPAAFDASSGTIQNLTAVSESAMPSQDKPDIQFPHGFFEFNITGLTHGQSVILTITLPSAVPDNAQYWKYGPTPSDSNPHWYQIAWTRITSNTISITLTDNGLGDDILTGADGVIVDQGGPGWPPIPSGGGHSAPVFPNIYVGIGAALGAGIVAYALRRRLAAHRTE